MVRRLQTSMVSNSLGMSRYASGPATKSTSLSESRSCTFSLSAMQPSTPTTGGLQKQAEVVLLLLKCWMNCCIACTQLICLVGVQNDSLIVLYILGFVFVLELFERSKSGPYTLLSLLSNSASVQENDVCVCVLLCLSISIISQN